MNRDFIESTLFDIINTKTNPPFENLNQHLYKFIPHLSSYSKSSSNIYFIFETINKQKDFYLLTFNLLVLETTSFHKIPFQNAGVNIKKIIFNHHSTTNINKNQETLLLLTENNELYLYDFSNNKLCEINIPLNNILKINFSPFENIIAILYSNNIFVLFNIYTNKEILKLNLFNNNSVVVDYNFFPYVNSYSLFSVLFMYENGTFSIITPFFPDDTYINISIFSNLKEINSIHCQSIEKTLNDSLVTKMNSCIGKDGFIHLNDYLLNWNEKLQYKHICPINGHDNKYKYKCFYFIENNTTPFVLFRIGNDINVIDIIVIHGEILPYREMKISINKKNITENIKMNNILSFYIIENLLIEENQLVNQKINLVNLCDNNIGLIINDGNIYTIEIPYLKSLNDLVLNDSDCGDICLYNFKSKFNKVFRCNNKSYQILPFIIFDNEVIVVNFTLQKEIKVKLFPIVIDINNVLNINNKQNSSLIEIDSLDKYVQPFQNEMNDQFKVFPLKEMKLTSLFQNNINFSSSEYEIDIINKINNDSLEMQTLYKSILDRIEFVNQFQKRFDNLVQKVITSTDCCINEVLGISTLKKEIIQKHYLIQRKIEVIKNELNKIQQNEYNKDNLHKRKIYKILANYVMEMKHKVEFLYNTVNKSCNNVFDDKTSIEFIPKGIGTSLKSLNKLEDFYLLRKNIKNLMDKLNINN